MNTPKPLNYQTLRVLRDGSKPAYNSYPVTERAKVPGGWLVILGGGYGYSGVTFYPDPEHQWDGSSLE